MEKDEKGYIYHIIDQYLLDKITSRTFADEFYYCYGKELDYGTLTEKERKLFRELSTITGRFSEFVEDDINYPGTYFTENELNAKVKEIDKLLK